MNSIQDMVDVNTIIGEPIETSNNIIIIPISKVTFGFAAGGSEFKGETIDEYTKRDKEEAIQYRLPFGGGSGAGVSINPVAFLIVQGNSVKMLPVNHSSAMDKLLDYVPDLVEKVNTVVNKTMNNMIQKEKQEQKQKQKEQSKQESQTTTIQENVTINKTRPKRNKTNKHPKPQQETFEYEYDEIIDPEEQNVQDMAEFNDEYDD